MENPTPQLTPQEISNKKLLVALLALLIPGIPIHKFVLGYTKAGIIQLVLTLLTCGFFSILAFVEGIIYLTNTDQQFYEKYILNKREWL